MKAQATKLTLLAAGALLAAGCSNDQRPKLRAEPNIELVQDMMDQKAIKAQDYDPFTGEAGSRLPPDNTVPQGYRPYRHKGDPDGAAKLKSPFSGDMSPEVLSIGQKKYETYCLICHGASGAGDGPVAGKMTMKPPPALTSAQAVGMTDGAIFHIITEGQGYMAGYAQQLVDEKDRWAIVNYVRSLQKLKRGQ